MYYNLVKLILNICLYFVGILCHLCLRRGGAQPRDMTTGRYVETSPTNILLRQVRRRTSCMPYIRIINIDTIVTLTHTCDTSTCIQLHTVDSLAA